MYTLVSLNSTLASRSVNYIPFSRNICKGIPYGGPNSMVMKALRDSRDLHLLKTKTAMG